MKCLVSIIIPCYNQAQYLSEALDSVIEQTYTNWECIIVNDGSSDYTDKIADRYCKMDSRFKYIFKRNGGLSSARNVGLELVCGEFVQFLDSDDKIDAKKIETQLLSFFENEELDISITDYSYFDNDNNFFPCSENWNNKISSDFQYDILIRWDNNFSIPIHSALFKKKILNSLRFNESLKAKEDWVFWAEISNNKIEIEYVDKCLCFYRMNPTSMVNNKELMQINYINALFIITEKFGDNHLIVQRLKNDLTRIIEEDKRIESNLNFQIARTLDSKAYKIGKLIIKPINFLRNKLHL